MRWSGLHSSVQSRVGQALSAKRDWKGQDPCHIDSQDCILLLRFRGGRRRARTSALGGWVCLPLSALAVRHLALRRPQPGQARFKLLVRFSLLPIRLFPSHHTLW